jgi:hypothetical protein
MSENRFNAVVILDAIPDGEMNTARRLKEDLEDIASYVSDGPKVLYARIETTNSLEDSISDLLHKVRDTGLQPWLHLEGHGLNDESGFVLADGTPCSWTKLKEVITPLNVATGLNLMIVLATCFGGSFTRAIRTTDRAPVWCLIGPTSTVEAGQVQDGFRTFYRTFFGSLSAVKAMQALNASAPEIVYFITTVEVFFYDAWKNYKKNHCSKEMIKKRAMVMYREAKSKNLFSISIGQCKRLLCSKDREKDLFEKCRDTYFMYDLYPLNRTRFPVTYNEAEAYVSED